MVKVGITGQAGFIGTHLYNTLSLFPDKFSAVPFEDDFFLSKEKLNHFVSGCDVIVHLAAMNRHHDPGTIFETNVRLVQQLIDALEFTGSRPSVIFSSSTQEERDNSYGNSKKTGREMLLQWAERNNASCTGLIIPNVFGPFGNPFYNSVVATFCHQLTHGQTPKIEIDGELKLIYVSELVDVILSQIGKSDPDSPVRESLEVHHTSEIKVSSLLSLLQEYKAMYFENGEMPDLADPFKRNLFNTFLTYIDHSRFFPFGLKLNTDDRGNFVETIKLRSGGQVSFSTTLPGITRGNHFHIRKVERFAVMKGKAVVDIRRIGTNAVLSFELDGERPSFVDMPVWYTHSIRNTGSEVLYTVFWINEIFNKEDPDTFFQSVI
jgi:UDP-2-acetamido-2,6-beta-L-arabino-hexul-4-ose reductase